MKIYTSKYILMFVVMVAFYACSTIKKTFPYQHINPPNGVLIGYNLYVDKTEVSNINYKEYLHFLKTWYSDKSFYQRALPDTTVWVVLDTCLANLVSDYFRNPNYDELPVVGISFTQAQNYTKWRQDRVLEMMLVQTKMINKIFEIDNVFSSERYFSGEIQKLRPSDTTTFYLEYNIPSREEWNVAIAYQDSLSNINGCKDHQTIWYNKYVDFCKLEVTPTTAVTWGCISENHKMIYNLFGNVSEWTSDGTRCTGGSFVDNLEDIKSTSLKVATKPTAWLGFRNVARWKSWKTE
ncbi:MAG TPA: SUMF1/EgtB/PvdO family nonheme iron enzyme [Saprospiraceae bacterium]|nr:SUMF1/EgtB/PvdO family nonheme iron enzyme [Saprospiraceae bacterium]